MQKTLLKFQNPIHKNIEDALLKADLKQYGKNVKFAKEEDGTSELSEATIKVLKKKIGSLLLYGRDVEMMPMAIIVTLESSQYHGTEAMDKAIKFLCYAS